MDRVYSASASSIHEVGILTFLPDKKWFWKKNIRNQYSGSETSFVQENPIMAKLGAWCSTQA